MEILVQVNFILSNDKCIDWIDWKLIFSLYFQLELRKMLLDRMINLLTRGCVVPVVKYIKQCCQKGDTDISLIRYFVTEVSEFLGKRKKIFEFRK